MALKDSWHRTLVYFGLAEEYDDEDYDPDTGPEVALEDRYRERPDLDVTVIHRDIDRAPQRS